MSSQEQVDSNPTGPAEVDTEDQAEAYDPLAALTIPELRAASKALGADVVTAITDRTENRTEALARVLWLHRRRDDLSRHPDDVWREVEPLTFTELSKALGELGPRSGVGPTRQQP